MIVGSGIDKMMRPVFAAVFLTAFAAPQLHAEQADADRRLIFAPVPLATPGQFQAKPPLRPPHRASVPLPPAKPARVARRANPPGSRQLAPHLSQTVIGQPGNRLVDLSTPQPQAVDLTPRLDLGGLSLGLATSRGNDTAPSGDLLSVDARTPIPTDPTLAPQLDKAKIPYVGLSLTAPTN